MALTDRGLTHCLLLRLSIALATTWLGETPDTAKGCPTGHRASPRPYQPEITAISAVSLRCFMHSAG